MKSITAIVIAMSVLASMPLHAQTYPAKAVRVVIPFPPGGAADTLIRPLTVKLADALGQQFVADARPGANGNIAAEIVARAPADGYTLLFGNSSLPISVSLYDKLSFDVTKDFTPVSMVAMTPSVLVVHPSLPIRNIKELIALAKKQPNKLNYASGGVGNTMHLAAALLDTMAGIPMTHVPNKGAGPAIVDVIAGQCDMVFVNIAPVLGHIRAGKAVPPGWAIDAAGEPTLNAAQALAGALLPFGGHKGSALSMMVELIAGPLIGEPTSWAAAALDNGDGGPPLGGELLIAMSPAVFTSGMTHDWREQAETFFAQAREQPGVRLPSDRRHEARRRSDRNGVAVPETLLMELAGLSAG